MSKIDKLIARIQTNPTDFTWEELTKLLNYYGYDETTKGKTSGSRRAFVHPITKLVIRLHKPHPGSILKQYQIKEIIELLNLDE